MSYDIKVGFSRLDITPPLGASIGGYLEWRFAEGILDTLEINTVAFEKDGKLAVILALDNLGFDTKYNHRAREEISRELSIDIDGIFIHSTHTHVSPLIGSAENLRNDIDREYSRLIMRKLKDGVRLAIADLTPAAMGYAETKAEKIAFNRRYLMTDGTTETNPGVNNPRIKQQMGLLDERVGVVRFKRADGQSIALVNFANHPDTVGGTKLTADWCGFTRRVLERALDDTKCVLLNGAEGDINHIKVDSSPAELADMIIDFDDVPRGYSHARHIGNVLAGAVMGVWEKMDYIPVDKLAYKTRTAKIPTNMPKPEELPRAQEISDMYDAGRIEELGYQGMMVTTVVSEAHRMLRLANGPEIEPIMLSGLKIGALGIAGIPGEPFTGIGIGIKESEGYRLVMPLCLTNGDDGYFPMQDSYDEGGYEARCSRFKAGIAELLIKEGKALLEELN